MILSNKLDALNTKMDAKPMLWTPGLTSSKPGLTAQKRFDKLEAMFDKLEKNS
jgi:hypothetical protein